MGEPLRFASLQVMTCFGDAICMYAGRMLWRPPRETDQLSQASNRLIIVHTWLLQESEMQARRQQIITILVSLTEKR